jgi:PQQ-dependent catabolism-associated CXXCW motif protein
MLLALSLAAAAPVPKDVEPGAATAPVPATLGGGTVVHAAAVKALLNEPGIVILDVSEVSRRPEGLAPGARWLPPQHRDIPGSTWIPGVGRKAISAELDSYYRSRLAELTSAANDRTILVYCHPNCWGSWNAAKRALGYGYPNVFWYPDGIEGWQDAGFFTVPADPEGPGAWAEEKRGASAKN